MHRDVKPGNLLRSHEGVVKLADFGIAKAAEDSEITKAGSVLGTAAYLSPEQARGEKAGPPADLYALGVVSYQLLTGPPALRGGLADRPRAPAGGRAAAEPPSDVDPDVPRALGEAVMRALHPLPEGRYEGALEMGDALERRPARRRARADRRHRGARPAPRRRGCSATRRPPRARSRHLEPPRQRTRRPLEPIDEPPRRRRARRAPAPAAAPRQRARRAQAPQPAPRRRRARRCCSAVVVVGVLAYQTVQDNTDRAVQLREDVRGDVQDAVDEIKGLIEDNTQ